MSPYHRMDCVDGGPSDKVGRARNRILIDSNVKCLEAFEEPLHYRRKSIKSFHRAKIESIPTTLWDCQGTEKRSPRWITMLINHINLNRIILTYSSYVMSECHFVVFSVPADVLLQYDESLSRKTTSNSGWSLT